MQKTTFNLIVTGTLLTIVAMFSFAMVYRPRSIDSARPPAVAPTSNTAVTNSNRDYPKFMLPDLSGKMISPADYRGKVVFINFWATWCAPCRREIPDFIELYKQYQLQGFEILGVALDAQGAEVVKPFVESTRMNYPILIGNSGVQAAYSVNAIPTTLILDREGKIYKQLAGAQSRTTFEALIRSLLSL